MNQDRLTFLNVAKKITFAPKKMAEEILIVEGSKQAQYESLLPQVEALLSGETDLIANCANLTAALKTQFNWLWVGFYFVREHELVLGPFQGPIACTRIQSNRGVCGAAWTKASTLIVPDVEAFPGHIACSSLSKSEIVVPLVHEGKVWGVLDVDSESLHAFDEIDQSYLERLVSLLNPSL